MAREAVYSGQRGLFSPSQVERVVREFMILKAKSLKLLNYRWGCSGGGDRILSIALVKKI